MYNHRVGLNQEGYGRPFLSHRFDEEVIASLTIAGGSFSRVERLKLYRLFAEFAFDRAVAF